MATCLFFYAIISSEILTNDLGTKKIDFYFIKVLTLKLP